MLPFVSEENYSKHKSEVEKILHRLHILEKTYPEAVARGVCGIMRLRRRIPDATKMAALCADVELHRMFFDSFSDRTMIPSAAAREAFSSEAALLSLLLRDGMQFSHGFVCIGRDRRGNLVVRASADPLAIYTDVEPTLAVDVCEHAYYGDYGFDKERYLRTALAHLKLSLLDSK